MNWQDVELVALDVDVSAGLVSVTVTGEVELGLLGVFVDESEPLTVRASAAASPELIP